MEPLRVSQYPGHPLSDFSILALATISKVQVYSTENRLYQPRCPGDHRHGAAQAEGADDQLPDRGPRHAAPHLLAVRGHPEPEQQQGGGPSAHLRQGHDHKLLSGKKINLSVICNLSGRHRIILSTFDTLTSHKHSLNQSQAQQ